MLFRRKKKATQPKARFYPEFKLHSNPFAITLFVDMLKEQIEYERDRPKPITPEERCEAFMDKYKDLELHPCPLCNGQSRLTISLRKFTQYEGFAGGYKINAKIHCSKCKCGLDRQLLYTNILFSGESDNIERVDEIVSSYVKEWNGRYDDLDVQRPDSYKEDKPDEI